MKDAKRLLLKLLFIASACFACADQFAFGDTANPYEVRWNDLASKARASDTKPATMEYSTSFLKTHATFWQDVASTCMPDALKDSGDHFDAVMILNASGRVTDSLPLPNSRHFECFRQHLIGKQYPKPPTSPFYEGFTVKLYHSAP